MFSNLRQLISSVTTDIISPPALAPVQNKNNNGSSSELQTENKLHLFKYGRPDFLQLLTSDEIRASASHNVRPIIVPRDSNLLPWGTGYAECINAGKSRWNEDQGAFHRNVLSDPTQGHADLPYTYFGIFDGHAGVCAAVAASQQLHHILHKKLVDCLDILLPRDAKDIKVPPLNSLNTFFRRNMSQDEYCKHVSKDDVIIGALESAFFEMDDLIEQHAKINDDLASGCTACVALFINGRIYVANAGDSRAVLCQRKSAATSEVSGNSSREKNDKEDHFLENNIDLGEIYVTPLSFDHTPETERQRLMGVAQDLNMKGAEYNANSYVLRPLSEDLGLRILCRQGTMKGWTYKTVTESDIKVPVVMGTGKYSRLLGTLGVTRGFGDHKLYSNVNKKRLKPFLTPQPEVNFRDLSKIVSIPGENNEDGDYGVLLLGTDGLWNVAENEDFARTVFQTLSMYPTEKYRYTMIAQKLVATARGQMYKRGHWRSYYADGANAADDISVFVIPIYQYYKEHVEWEQKCMREYVAKSETVVATEEQPIVEGTQEMEDIHSVSGHNEVANGVELGTNFPVDDKDLDNNTMKFYVNTSNSNVTTQEVKQTLLDENDKDELMVEAKLNETQS